MGMLSLFFVALNGKVPGASIMNLNEFNVFFHPLLMVHLKFHEKLQKSFKRIEVILSTTRTHSFSFGCSFFVLGG